MLSIGDSFTFEKAKAHPLRTHAASTPLSSKEERSQMQLEVWDDVKSN